MIISDQIRNHFSMNIEDEIITNIRLTSLAMLDSNSKKLSLILLGEIKEEYLQLNQVLYKYQAKRR